MKKILIKRTYTDCPFNSLMCETNNYIYTDCPSLSGFLCNLLLSINKIIQFDFYEKLFFINKTLQARGAPSRMTR